MKQVDTVQYSRDAKNFIKKADPKTKRQIKEGIDGLKFIPSKGDIKPLEGYTDGRLRLRVGRYRIIYRYDEGELLILYIIDIGSRGDVYK